jgi:hypothetical protein
MAPGTMRESFDHERVRLGICTGIDHPNRTVVAVWLEEKRAFVCGGDPRNGLSACGRTVIVSTRAWVKNAGSGS